MSEITPERMGQRISEVGLLEVRQLEAIWSELGTREVTLDQFKALLVRREMLTNYQWERLLKGERTGFFYGKYKVLYQVGSGTFARVYRAVETTNNRVVAVKVLRKRFRDDQVMTEQFLREGEIGSRLRHPNVVPIFEVSKSKSAPYLVMEFVEGQNLREMMKVRKKLDPLVGVRVVVDVLTALCYAAEQGMTHRDLKLSNVLISSRGKAKLVDFGLAAIRSSESVKDDDSPNARTIDYAGLERASGCRSNDPRSDLFFVGAMLYHMIAGMSPMIETRDRSQRLSMARYQNIKPLSQVDPTIPKSIVTFVSKALELYPEKRYGAPKVMHEDAVRILKHLESGDLSDPGEIGVAPQPNVAAAPVETELEGKSISIMLIESNVEWQDLLREMFKKHGYRILIFNDWARALHRIKDSMDKLADCIIFGAMQPDEETIDDFNSSAVEPATKNIPAILLLDPKFQAIAKTADLGPTRVMVPTPIKWSAIRDALRSLLKAAEAPPEAPLPRAAAKPAAAPTTAAK